MSNLAGKVALVTGGSRGIGAAIARSLAKAGAHVAFTFQKSTQQAEHVRLALEAEGVRALSIQADSGDRQALEAAAEQAVAAFGHIDILVHNAGIWVDGPIDSASSEDLDRILAVNVAAPVALTQAAVRHMRAGASVIAIGSCLADRVPGPGMSLYAMSKAALVGFIKGVARDLGPRGITANVVHPGPVDTDMNPASTEGAAAQRALLAVERFGRPEEVAAMVTLLAGEGGRYVTGASIAVDGGYTA